MLFNNEDHSLFHNFLAHTTQADNAIKYINNNLINELPSASSKKTIKLLDIGCGNGYKTLAIMQNLKEHAELFVTVLDPSEEMLNQFKKSNNGFSIDFLQTSWENYQPDNKFDLVFSLHTFYYIKHWENAIAKMLNCLNDGGVICITLRCNDEICKFKNTFLSKLNNQKIMEKQYSELCDTLDKMSIHYSSNMVTSELDISDCIAQNDQGRKLIEFMLRKPYNEIAPEFQHEIKEYLDDYKKHPVLQHLDGFIWITK